MSIKRLIPLFIFVILSFFLYISLQIDSKKLPSPLINKEFPIVKTKMLYDSYEPFTKEDFNEKYTLVNVWASWCATCRAEHATLLEIFKSKKVNMIGINYKDTKKDAIKYLEELGNPYHKITFDFKGEQGLELGVYATPETFVVNKNGIIKKKITGQLTKEMWDNEVLPKVKGGGWVK